jgi:hypothetical protein
LDFKDFMEPARRVQPLTDQSKPKIVGKTCRKCEEFFKQDMFLPTRSFFFPDGYLDICNNCLSKYLGACDDLHKADKFCQYGDFPFDPSEWINLQRTEQYGTFKKYCERLWAREYETINWKDTQEKWQAIMKEDNSDEKIGLFNAQHVNDLRKKWGEEFTDEQVLRFEQLYNDIEKTQSIVTAIQKDNARKMCMLSYRIEKALWDEDKNGSDVKSLISAYDQLAKAADFTPKTAKNVGDFESIGELCAFLEKKGQKFEFYDWKPKDDIDKVMQDLQNYTRRIVIGETNIAEELNDKLDMVQRMNNIENDGLYNDDEDLFSSVAIDDDLADEYNEQFEAGD